MGMMNLIFFSGMLLSAYYPVETEREGINYTFYQNSVRMSFGPKALLGDYGIETEDGRRTTTSFGMMGKSLAKTPLLAVLSDAIVNVTVIYEADWMGLISSHDLVHQALFVVDASCHDGIGLNFTQGAPSLSSIQSIEQASESLPDDDFMVYVARGKGEKVFSLSNFKVNQHTEDFVASVYFVDEGTSALIKNITVDILHGETYNFISPEKVEIGFDPNENILQCKNTGPLMTGCLLPPRELLPESEEQTEYSVRYQYSCIGEDLSIVLKTDLIEKELSPSEIPQEIVVTANHGSLWLDMKDPATSYASYVLPGCTLKILNAEGSISLALANEQIEYEKMIYDLVESHKNLFVMVKHLDNVTYLDRKHYESSRDFIMKSINEYSYDRDIFSNECLKAMASGAKVKHHKSCIDWAEKVNDIENMSVVFDFIEQRSKYVGLLDMSYELEEAIRETQTTLFDYYKNKLIDVIDRYQSFLQKSKLVSERSDQIIKESLDVLSGLKKN